MRRLPVLLVAAMLVLVGCDHDDDPAAPPSTTAPPVDGEEVPDRPTYDPDSPLDNISRIPSGFELVFATARVAVGENSLQFANDDACGVQFGPTGDYLLTSNFQHNSENRSSAPTFGYTDHTGDLAIWGLYTGSSGSQGEEWSGTGQGTPEIQLDVYDFGFGGNGYPVVGELSEDNRSYTILGPAVLARGIWTGEATENFTGEKSPGTIAVDCFFVGQEVLDWFANSGLTEQDIRDHVDDIVDAP